jgi:hypothetical protein
MHSQNWNTLMTSLSLAQTTQQLATELQDDAAPWLGVHTMSEFIFCELAGIIAAEQSGADSGVEPEKAPALGGLPTHDLQKLQEAMRRVCDKMKWPIAWNAGLSLFILGATIVVSPLALTLLVPLYFSSRWLWYLARQYRWLKAKLLAAERAAVAEPDWKFRVVQEIKWWSLIAAGFESNELAATLKNQELRLAGKPWRVLHRGADHYPVLQIDAGEEHHRVRSGKFSPQQFARIAAYSYLLNREMQGQSDWAIVLFGKSYEGIAIPLSDEIWRTFEQGLLTARQRLAKHQRGSETMQRPQSRITLCSGCPNAKPRKPGRPSVFNGSPVVPLLTETPDGRRVFHCTCGDRFRWVPPHEKSVELGLLS